MHSKLQRKGLCVLVLAICKEIWRSGLIYISRAAYYRSSDGCLCIGGEKARLMRDLAKMK